jgi:hypothetical protein
MLLLMAVVIGGCAAVLLARPAAEPAEPHTEPAEPHAESAAAEREPVS